MRNSPQILFLKRSSREQISSIAYIGCEEDCRREDGQLSPPALHLQREEVESIAVVRVGLSRQDSAPWSEPRR